MAGYEAPSGQGPTLSPWRGDGAPPTRTDWAEELLRYEILTGRLRPGEWLKISTLAKRYEGLSPTPAREALSRLAGSGLVELLPHRGVRVASVSREEIQDLYDNRKALEVDALRRSLERADADFDDDLRRTHGALVQVSETAHRDAQRGSLSTDELVAWERAHRSFHLTLLSRCSSPWLLRLVEIVYDNSTRYRYLTLRSDEGQSFVSAVEMHRGLLDAALARDVDAALEELHVHMRLTLDAVEELELP